MQKFFGIGLSKTGTTSLATAFEILGYSSIHLPDNLDILDRFDTATDLPIAIHYKDLDQKYPNSKFILTVRDIDEWLVSMKSHFDRLPPSYVGKYYVSLRWQAYGCEVFDEDAMRKAYIRHNEEVRSYFKDRTGDLLVLDICGGEGWDQLCPFLGVPIPEVAFPFSNRDPSIKSG